jgi:hypothetical protein
VRHSVPATLVSVVRPIGGEPGGTGICSSPPFNFSDCLLTGHCLRYLLLVDVDQPSSFFAGRSRPAAAGGVIQSSPMEQSDPSDSTEESVARAQCSGFASRETGGLRP